MMRREKVDHILRAAHQITGKSTFVLIGSAAIVAWRVTVPEALAMSRDVDLFAYDAVDAERVSEQLDGSLGLASQFDSTFGYYCDGVGPETAILPTYWEARSLRYESTAAPGVVAIVPDPNDIALAKLCAWRPKDIDWLRAAASHAVVDLAVMHGRLGEMPDRGPGQGELARRLSALITAG